MTWGLAAVLCHSVVAVWMFSWIFRRLDGGWDWSNWIFFELRPFIPALIVAVYLLRAMERGTDDMGWRIVTLIIGFYWWWESRNEDDDRWKRRRRALADRVAQIGGKLAVVPAEGGK